MTDQLFSSTTTPLTPPKMEEDRLSWLRLFRSRRVGVSTFFRLLGEHGSASDALLALPEVARDAGLNEYEPASEQSIDAEVAAARRSGARLICFPDDAYPALLREIPDPPPVLWAIGDTSLLAQPMVAVVGARNASGLGQRTAKRIAGDLAQAGCVVVSGLARGIDAAAHEAALETGTVAVLAGGVDVAYPQDTLALFGKIGSRGVRLSEQPMGLSPQSRHFPRRNRIISGLAPALVVVEAASKSGSLLTARAALDQGRDVLAVPGHPFDARAAGCNLLIRDGARLVRSAEDVLEVLPDLAPTAETIPLKLDAPKSAETPASASGERSWRDRAALAGKRLRRAPSPLATPPSPAKPAQTRPAAMGLRGRILDTLALAPVAEDQLIRDLGMQAQDVAPALVELELEGAILRQPGGLVARRA
ncbi:MAG: DNA-processing protein DprA [Pseudomonadota bacterium]